MAQRSDVRRAQLISPFGPGALTTNAKGVSLICSALDFWYPPTATGSFRMKEWRLEKRLNGEGIPVTHFRLPPEYKPLRNNEPNTGIRIPAARFPRWHFCPSCSQLGPVSATQDRHAECGNTQAHNGARIRLHQVRFVAMCANGHLSDFPWREWVHSSASPDCKQQLWLEAAGGATLASIIVRCSCGKRRSLEGITGATPDKSPTEKGTSTLSTRLQTGGGDYTCRGHKPWAGNGAGGAPFAEECGAQLRGSLRGASNLYFAQTVSSLSLPPRDEQSRLTNLAEYILRAEPHHKFAGRYTLVQNGTIELDELVSLLLRDLTKPPVSLKNIGGILADDTGGRYTEEDLTSAARHAVEGSLQTLGNEVERVDTDSEETAFRRPEYQQLQQEINLDELTITNPGQDQYDASLRPYISRVMLVERLRETRVLTGISRIDANLNPLDPVALNLLWRGAPQDWLPANVVHGEGIFLEFDEKKLIDWEGRMGRERPIRPYFDAIVQSYQATGRAREKHLVAPRFVLLHTFAHLLINQLVFECGYSTASLRERLYVSADKDSPMAGILIYTSAGDSDGTLGGLVRLGRPGSLEPFILRAINNASWCAADPVCMEMADHGGQGPYSCNLAACHNCALLPETSCEEFNRFLDRGHVIGIPSKPDTGYFEKLISGAYQ